MTQNLARLMSVILLTFCSVSIVTVYLSVCCRTNGAQGWWSLWYYGARLSW